MEFVLALLIYVLAFVFKAALVMFTFNWMQSTVFHSLPIIDFGQACILTMFMGLFGTYQGNRE